MVSGSEKSSPGLVVTDTRTGKTHTIPIHPGGYVDAVAFSNIRDARGDGLVMYDEGSRNTACVKSAVSHLNADNGSLQYRQYDIADLFGCGYGFAENTSLLVFGYLPNGEQRKSLDKSFAQSMLMQLDCLPTIQSFPRDAPMMTMIMGGLSACNALEPNLIPVHTDRDVYGEAPSIDEHVVRTLSALAVVISASYCHKLSSTFRRPRSDLRFIENMLYMMSYSAPGSDTPDHQQVRHVEDLVLLHSEHGTCNATAAFLHTASTRADPISSLLAGLAAIYGPMHGGSNLVTYHQIQKIAKVENIPAVIAEVKGRKRRLYGFGHRIYRAIDPRATLLKLFLKDRAKEGIEMSPLLQVALELERIIDTDEFFTSRKLKANTDLYTVLAYEAVGVPEELVFPFICISRAQGFLAHWREMMAKSPTPWRPQQIYTGPPIQRPAKI